MQDKFWYKTGWSLDMKHQTWTEDTENQVEFIIQALQLQGSERILDLACGYGRHALAFARRGFCVVGVDITQELVDDASKSAQENALSATFMCADIRAACFENEFDVVLNLADGAIGYLETDEENLKIFDVIARALKPGGKHFMDICNAEHAQRFFPKRHWQLGEKELALAVFDWDDETRRMLFGGGSVRLGEIAQAPVIVPKNPTRLYMKDELTSILQARGMEILRVFSGYTGKPQTSKELQLLVCAEKRQHA
ncbi:MAG: class I SAM-dependent methyltransferase [Oscillospiraceae bacterium]|nr:class I SAM-dependent methyltransferase [Oscillospiraceae bacterium]